MPLKPMIKSVKSNSNSLSFIQNYKNTNSLPTDAHIRRGQGRDKKDLPLKNFKNSLVNSKCAIKVKTVYSPLKILATPWTLPPKNWPYPPPGFSTHVHI